MGRPLHPTTRQLLIMADGGDSNGYRLHLWKAELKKLADETGLSIKVCHLPPGTSKWNKIEHRLFSLSWPNTDVVACQIGRCVMQKRFGRWFGELDDQAGRNDRTQTSFLRRLVGYGSATFLYRFRLCPGHCFLPERPALGLETVSTESTSAQSFSVPRRDGGSGMAPVLAE
jgi:hypothetical protein